MSWPKNSDRKLIVVDENNELDVKAMREFNSNFVGPLYFDESGEIYVVEYRVQYSVENGTEVVDTLVPFAAWERGHAEQIKKAVSNNPAIRAVNALRI